jgi:hypothetical protein
MPLMWPKGLGFWVLDLIRNNIFLDKAYELSTYREEVYEPMEWLPALS